MALLSNKRREEVETSIRSCLVAHQGDVTIQQLDKDYVEFEGEHIPYNEFGCSSLIEFLKQLRNILWIENRRGFLYIHAIDSEKSRHVSSLVEGQRRKRLTARRSHRPSYGFTGGRPQVSINYRLMMHLIREVNLYPDGINLDWAIQYVNKVSRPIEITRNELERQLREISHEVKIYGNNLYPAKQPQHPNNTYIPLLRRTTSNQSSSNDTFSHSTYQTEAMPEHTSSIKKDPLPIRFTGEDDDAIAADDIVPKYPSGFTPTSDPPKRNGYRDQESSKQNYESQDSYRDQDSYRKQDSHREQDSYRDQNSDSNQDSYRETSNHPRDFRNMANSSRDRQNSYDDTKYSKESRKVSKVNYDREDYEDDFVVNDDYLDDDYEEDRSVLINERIRARLEVLIQNHPDGIWCADLPQKYLEEFKITLGYADLGFDSVRDFASQLPSVFHCVRPTNAGDYKLYNAKLPPPDLRKMEPPTRETLASKYLIYDDQDDPEAFPGRLDPSTSIKLFPEGAMEIRETVGHISVTELGKEHDFEEVEVSEVFTPSFFWIQLRRKLPKFKKFMYELHVFYESNKSKFRIPLIMLEKGLNVACLYAEKWHRGIIKTVLPDGRSTVHFYDYGTVKSYAPDELYFLHRQFSYLPAQAIPCGLFNVRPYQTEKWSKSITWEFVSKTSVPLIATIGARDEEENSMLVSLTDTRGDEDHHINDWMYLKKYAQQGHMVRIRSRNFAFNHYRECLERKGYDPNTIHEFYVEYDDSNLSDNTNNDVKEKLLIDSLSREKQKDAPYDPFFPATRESLPINANENRNSQQSETHNPHKVLERNDVNFLKTRSRNAQETVDRDYKFSKSGRLAVNNPEESSPEISALNRENRVHKHSTHRDYKFLKSDRVETKTAETEVVEVTPVETKVVEDKPVESKIVEIKTVVPEFVEVKPVESKPSPGHLLMLKRTQALLAKYKVEKEKDLLSPSSPENGISSSSEYKKTSESPKPSSPSQSISSFESESKIDKLRRFMMKIQTSNSTDSLEKRDRPAPIKKLALDLKVHVQSSQSRAEECNLDTIDHDKSEHAAPTPELKSDSKNQFKCSPKSESLPASKSDSPLITESDSDSIPVHSPLLLKGNPEEEKKEVTFFGTITSECGGSGRMEPMDWTAIRIALEESEGQFSTPKNKRRSRSIDLSTRLSKTDVPLVDDRTMFIIDNDPNSAQYERDVKWLPAGNIKHSRTSVSPLLKLKQRLLVNSYKKSAVLISSKMVSILKGELQDVLEDDETAEFEKVVEVENPEEVKNSKVAQKLEEVEKSEQIENPEEDEKHEEAEKTEEIEKVEEPKPNDEDEEEKKRQEEVMHRKVQLYIEAQKLRAYQDPYSSLASATSDELKQKKNTKDVSELIKGFVVKHIDFCAKRAERLAELPSDPVVVKSKKKKSRKKRRSKSVTPDLLTSSAEGENESGEKEKVLNSPEEAATSPEKEGKPKSSEKRKKKRKPKDRRSLSTALDLLNSSTEGTSDRVEKEDPEAFEMDKVPALDDSEEPKSLEREEHKISTLNEVSSVLSNNVTEENKLDSVILTNVSEKEEDPSNLLDEKDQVPDLIDEEEELMKLIDSSLELNSDFKKEQSILNVVDCLSAKSTKSIILEKFNNMKSPSSCSENLDSDDFSNSDDEEKDEEDLIKDCKTMLIPVTKPESSKQDYDQTFEIKIEEIKTLEKSQELDTNSEAKIKVDKNIVYEEILLNPSLNENEIHAEANKRSPKIEEITNSNSIFRQEPGSSVSNEIVPISSTSPLIFNDVDITSDDEEWDVMSYLSTDSYRADPCFRVSKNYRRTCDMIQNYQLHIEEIPNKEINSKEEPKSNGIVPPNFKYPDEMKLSNSTEDSLISRISSSGKNSVNGNRQEFINFQYTQEMKSTIGSNIDNENSSAESEAILKSDSTSLDFDDFAFNSTNSSVAAKNYEPPGKSKSLKNMLLQMKQK